MDETGQPYAYTGDDPVNGVDPLGQNFITSAWDDTGGKVVHGVARGYDAVNEGVDSGLQWAENEADNVTDVDWNGIKSFATGLVGSPRECGANGSAYEVGNVTWWVASIGGLLAGGVSTDEPDLVPAPEVGVNGVPQSALDVLQYVEAHDGAAPTGYSGGRTFGNYEGLLPADDSSGSPISYKEYDVNPFQKGVDRGAERLVVGSDGSAYYTNDHYNSFIPVK